MANGIRLAIWPNPRGACTRNVMVGMAPIDRHSDPAVAVEIRSVLTLLGRHPISRIAAICGALAAATSRYR